MILRYINFRYLSIYLSIYRWLVTCKTCISVVILTCVLIFFFWTWLAACTKICVSVVVHNVKSFVFCLCSFRVQFELIMPVSKQNTSAADRHILLASWFGRWVICSFSCLEIFQEKYQLLKLLKATHVKAGVLLVYAETKYLLCHLT